MHLRDSHLGFEPISTAASLIGVATGLRDLFGGGAKKKAIDQLPEGAWVSKYPAGIDWNALATKQRPDIAQVYNKLKSRNDSMLIKNNIASLNDFAAWWFHAYGQGNAGDSPGAACDPNERNKGATSYISCPVYKNSGINIFDEPALAKWVQDEAFKKAEEERKLEEELQARADAEAQRLAKSSPPKPDLKTQIITTRPEPVNIEPPVKKAHPLVKAREDVAPVSSITPQVLQQLVASSIASRSVPAAMPVSAPPASPKPTSPPTNLTPLVTAASVLGLALLASRMI